MPTISMFYGVLILMYFYDNKKHNRPHIHAEYGEYQASIAIDDGVVVSGDLPTSKLKLVQAWMRYTGKTCWWIGSWRLRASLCLRLIR